jgi:glycosidase
MKRILFAIVSSLFVSVSSLYAQSNGLLSWSPQFITDNNPSDVVITVDASKGNQGLFSFTNDVYVHIGVITSQSTGPSNWKYVQTTWASTASSALCTPLGGSKWKYTLPGNLRAFFGMVDPTETILKIAILFRNGSGSLKQANTDNSDMYVPVYPSTGAYVRFNKPLSEPRYYPFLEPISVAIGQALPIEAVASTAGTMKLLLNGTTIATAANATSITNAATITQSCSNQLVAELTTASTTSRDTINFFVQPPTVTASLPSGLQDGINYEPGDTAVTLVLFAPNKSNVLVLGSFNNYIANCQSQMKKTPDGNRFWTRITGLIPGVKYNFQYVVDGLIKIADPYSELILDPNNDQYISPLTYPNIPPYPVAKTTGMVGVFQTAAPTFPFTATNYQRPAKENLMIYELLIRDFTNFKNYQSLIDTLSYFKNLGVNAIELMPIFEFDGNESWGYNPCFYFAPDKYYGTKQKLQEFIDEAHKKGIAIILDIALNHVTGNSPLAQLYWDGTNNQPTNNNPWLNPTPKHPFNVFNDFNHESAATKYHVYRFIRHWLTEYKVDGFRWDLSKGFTQVNSGSNVGAWGNYDASRIAIWKNYYDSMQAVAPGSYCILEHFGGDQEEIELANYGMLLWNNLNYESNQNTMGYINNSTLYRAYAPYKGYTKLGLISYAESHDEERLMYKNINFGFTNSNYDVKSLNIGLQRMEALNALMLLIPGAKMYWQFGELGYDYSINTCVNGTVNNNCRLDPKPIRWDYLQNTYRKRLKEVVGSISRLRAYKPAVFSNQTVSNGTDISGVFVKKLVLSHNDMKVVVLANFDVTTVNTNIDFPSIGLWKNYLTGESLQVNSTNQSFTLSPGAYKVFINDTLSSGVVTTSVADLNKNEAIGLRIYPNPTQGSCTVDFESQSGSVRVDLYNNFGMQVKNLYSGMTENGFNSIKINYLDQKPGVYFIKLQLNEQNYWEPLVVE